MEPTTLALAAAAVVKWFAGKVVGKVGEQVGAKAGDAVVALLRDRLSDPDERATLARVEHAPTSTQAQEELQRTIERRSMRDPQFAEGLAHAYQAVKHVQQQQTFNNQGYNHGAQGVFNSPVTFNTSVPRRKPRG